MWFVSMHALSFHLIACVRSLYSFSFPPLLGSVGFVISKINFKTPIHPPPSGRHTSFLQSSSRTEAQRVAPQPTAPTENISYEIPSGMIEQLLANSYAGDGTKHPDMHLIHVDEICALFKLAGLSGDEVNKKVLPLTLGVKALTWHRLCDDIGSWNWNRLKL